jgi:hypothetical protein
LESISVAALVGMMSLSQNPILGFDLFWRTVLAEFEFLI